MNTQIISRGINLVALSMAYVCAFMLSFSIDAQEICGNGIDDDGNGLIDYFDTFSDCLPDENGFFGIPVPSCEAKLPPNPSFSIYEENRTNSSSYVAVHSTPLVADLDGDGQPEIIAAVGNKPYLTLPVDHGIYIFDHKGILLRYINTPNITWNGAGGFGVADLDHDGRGEIVFGGSDRYLYCYEDDGNLKWKSDLNVGYYGTESGGSIAFADFDHNGDPEVYIYNQIFNGQTGKKLAEGGVNNSKGMGVDWGNFPSVTFAVDMLPNVPGLELVAGNQVYEVILNNVNDLSGNQMNIASQILQLSPTQVAKDGFAAVADLDNDNDLDIAVVASLDTYQAMLYVWEGETGDLLGEYTSFLSDAIFSFAQPRYSIPTIGDVDGDGISEIIFTTHKALRAYKLDEAGDLVSKWLLSTSDDSGSTGVTLFDFNQDGVVEIVYRDESIVRIFNGRTTPITLASFGCKSVTALEMPVIADVDNDGQAEILVTCETTNIGDGYRGEVIVYGTNGDPWAPARKVWNQYVYQPTAIEDDLNVPRTQQNHAFSVATTRCGVDGINRPLNHFLVQSTFLDKEGCTINPVPDVSLEIDSTLEAGNVLTVFFRLTNEGSQVFPAGSAVSFYEDNPLTTNCIGLGVYRVPQNLEVDSTWSAQISLDISPFLPTGIPSLYGVANDDPLFGTNTPYTLSDFPRSQVAECNYANNLNFALGVALSSNPGTLPPAQGSQKPPLRLLTYPNPSLSGFKIQLDDEDIKQGQLSIFTPEGHTIIHRNFQGSLDMQISTETWAPGIYFCRVMTGHRPYYSKIVVESR